MPAGLTLRRSTSTAEAAVGRAGATGQVRLPAPARLAIAVLPVGLLVALLGVVLVLGSLTGSPSPGTSEPNPCTITGAASDGSTSLAGLNVEQTRDAAVIIAVGRQLRVPARGWLIAIATALQESTLRNLDYGDRDSLGLFQQRAAWGSAADRTNPAVAARLFYRGGRGGQPGLLDIPGWESMAVSQAAQAVQRSAFPDAYARWESFAQQIVGAPSLASVSCAGEGDALGAAVIAAATRWIGTPYSWGGGGLEGPTVGFGSGAAVVGFDCSSLARYAWYTATGGRVLLPRVSSDQAATAAMLPPGAALAVGDLMFFHDPADPPTIYHHVGIYAGGGAMIDAPHTGAFVERVEHVLDIAYYREQYAGAIRPGPDPGQTGTAPTTLGPVHA